jgi:UDP-MurNAc hydroxylase
MNIGGATAILEHQGKRIMFDPWLNDGIFHGAWYHYPPLQVSIKDIGRIDYLYISHIHEDHCAAGTIQYLNRDAEVILMDRQPNFVAKFLDLYGFKFQKVHLIKPRVQTQIAPNLYVDIIEADPSHELNYQIDSALIIKWDNFTVYNANDCPPYSNGLEYIQKQYEKVDLALLPYAGGSGYPSCYTNLSHTDKLREKQRIFEQNLQLFVDTVKALQPSYAVPFADQYVVAGSRSVLNQYLAHPPDGSVVIDALKKVGLEDKVLLLNSGQVFDFDTKEKYPDFSYKKHSEENRNEYINSTLHDKYYDHEMLALNLSVPIERMIAYARSRLWQVQRQDQYFPKFAYYLDIPDRNRIFRIALDSEIVEELSCNDNLPEPYLRIILPTTLLVLLLIGHISWNIADAALFLDYERCPNIYNSRNHALINHLRL